MPKFSLDYVQAFLDKGADKKVDYYTIRLLNKRFSSPNKYIFVLLHFDTNKGTWVIQFLQQNNIVRFEVYGEDFTAAKQVLLKEMLNYINSGYEVTSLTSTYDIPDWLRRKRK